MRPDASMIAVALARAGRCSGGFGRWLALLCVACAALHAVSELARASIATNNLQIQVVGLKFKYQDDQLGSLYDATSMAGGQGELSTATQVQRIDFFRGGQMIGSLPGSDGLFVDFRIQGIHNIPKTGGMVTTGSLGPSFGFDLLSAVSGRFLSLDLDAVTVSYIRNQTGRSIQFSFVAGGPSAALLSQSLPFGLVLDENAEISVRVSSLKLTGISEDDQYLRGFNATGTGSVNGILVPEPGCFAAILLIGVAGFEFRAWRRRKAAQEAEPRRIASLDPLPSYPQP